MADQDRLAGTSHRVIHTRRAVCGRCDQLRSGGVETDVKDLIIVTAQRLHTLAARHIPYLARAVDGSTDT